MTRSAVEARERTRILCTHLDAFGSVVRVSTKTYDVTPRSAARGLEVTYRSLVELDGSSDRPTIIGHLRRISGVSKVEGSVVTDLELVVWWQPVIIG